MWVILLSVIGILGFLLVIGDLSWPVVLVVALSAMAVLYLALWWLQSCKVEGTPKEPSTEVNPKG